MNHINESKICLNKIKIAETVTVYVQILACCKKYFGI